MTHDFNNLITCYTTALHTRVSLYRSNDAIEVVMTAASWADTSTADTISNAFVEAARIEAAHTESRANGGLDTGSIP